jgi:predicted signal transduction protein with EAL and GGDEF domain
MIKGLVHEIELYPTAFFMTLLEHEVHRARRYGYPLTLLHIQMETEPADPQILHRAEVFAIDVLNLRLRETDIPTKMDNEFLVLMPSTNEEGGRIACQRLEELFHSGSEAVDQASFKLFAFMGMATLPGGSSISSKKLLENAALALQEARANRQTKAILFSEMKI